MSFHDFVSNSKQFTGSATAGRDYTSTRCGDLEYSRKARVVLRVADVDRPLCCCCEGTDVDEWAC